MHNGHSYGYNSQIIGTKPWIRLTLCLLIQIISALKRLGIAAKRAYMRYENCEGRAILI